MTRWLRDLGAAVVKQRSQPGAADARSRFWARTSGPRRTGLQPGCQQLHGPSAGCRAGPGFLLTWSSGFSSVRVGGRGPRFHAGLRLKAFSVPGGPGPGPFLHPQSQ